MRNRISRFPLNIIHHERQRAMKIIFRWLMPQGGTTRCYDCLTTLPTTRPPYVRLTHITQDQSQLTVRPQPLCDTCWLIHDKLRENL